ncbi:MAG TPA: LysM peptidoglycan-binding domain-containing protein [Polyangiaceae bacterium]|nr:LysM peptidoglycan-binding domain-containing protein [Polyangiaceae bacterium]
MRRLVARYPVWLVLCLSPALAAAQAKPGSLPAAPAAKDEPAKSEKKAPAKPPAPTKPAAAPAAKPAPATKAESAARAEPTKPEPVKPAPAKSEPAAKAEPAATPKPEASDKPAANPARGAGSRSVAPAPAPEPKEPPSAAPEKPITSGPAGSHQKGRPPSKPSPTLPPGATRSSPDESARQHITGGSPSDDQVKRGANDAELLRLREAERVLFPQPLRGVELGFDFPAPTVTGPEVDASGLPTGVTTRPSGEPVSTSDAAWLRSLTQPDLPTRYDERVVRYLRFYRDTPSGRSIARIWAKKSGRFTAAIKAELSRAGLPLDLIWLSLIESGHNPTIASPVGAAGLWQFMPDAARSYGLTVDRWVDERLDPERSTQAAVRYLSDLYRRFGSWELAMAAYNMGYGGLSRSVRKFNTNNFWELSRYEAGIPWETTLYVPKILATAVLMNNRRAFGLDSVTEDPPERFDVVVVGPSVTLSDVARAVGSNTDGLEALNPQFLAGRTPPAAPGAPRTSYRVRVPAGSGAKWTPTAATRDDGLEPYVVKAGETVERIARAYGTSERELREKNRVAADEVLTAGTVLLVPRISHIIEPDPTTAAELVVVPSRSVDLPDRKRVFYRVVSGDTATGVATAFRVTPQDLADWNALDVQARLEPGMSLQVFVAKNADLSKVLHVPEAHAKILIAGSPEFCDYFEGQNGKKRLLIAAREGDTLGSIGKRYGMTVGQMERVNRRGRSDQVAPGERIIVYTERAKPAPGDTLVN